MTVLSIVLLLLLLATAAAAICSAHIPGLRELTGAAPLEHQPTAEPFTSVTETDESWLRGDFTAPRPHPEAPVIPSPKELALRLELRRANDQIAALRRELAAQRSSHNAQLRALEDRLAQLQAANEGAYRQQYDAAGGPRFDPAQPVGQPAPRTTWAAALQHLATTPTTRESM